MLSSRSAGRKAAGAEFPVSSTTWPGQPGRPRRLKPEGKRSMGRAGHRLQSPPTLSPPAYAACSPASYLFYSSSPFSHAGRGHDHPASEGFLRVYTICLQQQGSTLSIRPLTRAAEGQLGTSGPESYPRARSLKEEQQTSNMRCVRQGIRWTSTVPLNLYKASVRMRIPAPIKI